MTQFTIVELEQISKFIDEAIRYMRGYNDFTADHERVEKDINEFTIIQLKMVSYISERKMIDEKKGVGERLQCGKEAG